MTNYKKIYVSLVVLLVLTMTIIVPAASGEEIADSSDMEGVVTIIGSGSDEDGADITDREAIDDDPEAEEPTGKIGILAYASGSIRIKKGIIDTIPRGIDLAAEGGTIDLTTGSILSGSGITAALNGGSITADTGSIYADKNFGVNILAENGGKADFLISGGESKSGGSSEEDSFTGGGIYSAAEGISAIADNSSIDIFTETIDANGDGADLTAVNGGTVILDSAEITANETGLRIEASGSGSEITADSYDIYAENLGLGITVDGAAKVTVNTDEGSVYADHAIDIQNEGGTVEVLTGELDARSGLSIRSGSGATTARTADMLVENYGLLVNVTKAETEEGTESENTGASAPVVDITVDGDIISEFVEPDPGNSGIEDPTTPIVPAPIDSDPNDASISKDAEEPDADAEEPWEEDLEWLDDEEGWSEAPADPEEGSEEIEWDEWETEELDPEIASVSASGVILSADIDGANVSVNVNGEIDVQNSNEVSAENGAKIKLKTAEDVTAGAGNYFSASNGGSAEITLDQNVFSQKTAVSAWCMDGNLALTINGDVKGSENGMEISAYNEGPLSFTDILVTDTIMGRNSGLIINDEADNDGTPDDNLSLTVWAVSPAGVKNEAGEPNEKAGGNIKYIIRIDPESADKIEAVREDGTPLDTSHGYPVAKPGEKIYIKSLTGEELEGILNGKDSKTALPQDDNGYYLDVPAGGGVWLSVGTLPQPADQDKNEILFHIIEEVSWLLDRELPGTGFPASHALPLPARPKALSYGTTGLTLQIPRLDVLEPIVIIPQDNGSYPIEWLGRDAGLLEQSSLPGKGISVLTGHNHLNTTEIGPFLFIKSLEENDRIMITDEENTLDIYRVYGNYKIPSDGFADVAEHLRPNTLVLMTCEDESINGGYLNRRVVFAEPLQTDIFHSKQ